MSMSNSLMVPTMTDCPKSPIQLRRDVRALQVKSNMDIYLAHCEVLTVYILNIYKSNLSLIIFIQDDHL